MSATMGFDLGFNLGINLRFKKLLSLSVLGVAMTISSQATAGSIVQSAHDFTSASGGAWDTQICLACHTPHNASAGAQQIAPLWGHDTTAATFALYTGVAGSGALPNTTSLDAVTNQPSGTSLLCLSCHDGTVAVDSFGGKSGAGTILIGTLSGSRGIVGSGDLGTDLSNDHPISFLYDDVLAAKDGSLHDPLVQNVTTLASPSGGVRTGTISEVLLENGSMECSSCHDVHNTFTGTEPMLLKVSITGSQLCLTCHNK